MAGPFATRDDASLDLTQLPVEDSPSLAALKVSDAPKIVASVDRTVRVQVVDACMGERSTHTRP